jgi:hypothetical protein
MTITENEIEIDFVPSCIVYFQNWWETGTGEYSTTVTDYIWGEKELFYACQDYFIQKIIQMNHGMLMIERSTLKYKVIELKIKKPY